MQSHAHKYHYIIYSGIWYEKKQELAFLFFDFVAAEVLLSFSEDDMFAQNRIVFAQTEFVRGVHRVFLGVVSTNSGFFGN